MAERVTEFSRLLDRVARSTGSVVNFADLRGVSLRLPELQLRGEQFYHYGSFCLHAKFHNRNIDCARNKEKSKQRAAAQNSPFWGCCPYGLWDLAYPATWNGALVGIFYLGHFRGDEPLKPVAGKAFSGPLPPRITDEKREELLRYGAFLTDYLRLALDESLGELEALDRGQSLVFYRDATSRYIAFHYHEPINLQTFAVSLGLHPNYLGQQIKQAHGRTFSQLLSQYRIERARTLLRSTNKTITEIAFECGFRDSNYFSTVFRAAEGMAPRAYRGRG